MHGVNHQFDLARHQRERLRSLERHNAALEQVRRRLERLLAITLRVAAGDDCDPHTLLRVIEQLDQEAERGRTIDELAQLLRETAPSIEGRKQEAAA